MSNTATRFTFTSESVSEGHPDKVADQISDAVLDAILAQDPRSRVAAETLCNTGLVVMAGEITTAVKHDYGRIARETIRRIGYNDPELRRDGRLPWARPDAKSQVSVRYVDGRPHHIDTVVISTQHSADISHEPLTEAVIEQIVKPVLPKNMITKDTRYLINPTGRFVIGGPQGDTGLTGRKIIVDTYGGYSRHGGGAFSGKDPSKVDRSAAYAARYVAKNIVAAGLAKKCEIQVAYAIGIARPVSVLVETFGTGKIPDDKLAKLVERHFDLRPKGIIHSLDLLRPIYEKTAAYGHFGRDEPEFTWESTNKAAALRSDAGVK